MFDKDIFVPIQNELTEVKKVLEDQIHLTESLYGSNLETLNYFFRVKGKFLRPALVLLSANAIGKDISTEFRTIVYLAAAVELIHSASLIHDDLIDESAERRGQQSVQHVFNKKLAVLSGDFMLVRAISILTCLDDDKYLKMVVPCIEGMCFSEIDIFNKTMNNLNNYLQHIQAKTSQFMSVCCQMGGMAAKGNEKQVQTLMKYGHYFGMLYQIVDDYMDRDVPFSFEMVWDEKIRRFGDQALENLKGFKTSVYTKSMIHLTRYLMLKNRRENEFALKE